MRVAHLDLGKISVYASHRGNRSITTIAACPGRAGRHRQGSDWSRSARSGRGGPPTDCARYRIPSRTRNRHGPKMSPFPPLTQFQADSAARLSLASPKSFAILRLPQRSSTSRYEIGREMGIERCDTALVCLRESVTDKAVRAHEKSTIWVHAGAGEVEICTRCD